MAEKTLHEDDCTCCGHHHHHDHHDHHMEEAGQCSCCDGEAVVSLSSIGTCSCCHDEDVEEEEGGALWTLVVGTLVFLITYLTDLVPEAFSLPAYIVAYLLLGYCVLREAAENILKRQPFDENFLMAVATIGAFAIGDYPEAVAVMLFSRVDRKSVV